MQVLLLAKSRRFAVKNQPGDKDKRGGGFGAPWRRRGALSEALRWSLKTPWERMACVALGTWSWLGSNAFCFKDFEAVVWARAWRHG